ncbi:MAG TPA: cytochrome c3 family protein [Gallionella sp.]|nr:cytochrome c3 family protein [Gallionella sp.]
MLHKETAISGESIQIGRSALCKIHLLDHRVNSLHATIKRTEDGNLYIEAEKDATMSIDGFTGNSAPLSPGMRVEIGPYLLVVESQQDGHDIALSVEMTQPLSELATAKAYRNAPVTLAGSGLSKRKWSFILATGILFLFLLLPLLPSTSPALDKWQATLPITFTESWNPGPLSGGHGIFGAKCSTCHQRAFQAVSNDACTACHKHVAKHLATDDPHTDIFKNMHCTDCHLDHRGKAGLVLHDQSACVACHGNIKNKKTNTALANVHDFEKDHPPFRIALQGDESITRVRQDEKSALVEKPRLKYSHRVHLDAKGVSSPLGRIVMACRDCHHLDKTGAHFKPMSMQETCQQSRCHKLYFTEPIEGLAPHGSEREVMNKLREYYIQWLTDSTTKNMAACAQTNSPVNAVKRVLECANDLAQKNAATTLFKEDGEDLECVLCHEISKTENRDVPWKIKPLRISRDFQPGAVFPHSKHDTVNCTECHDKVNSKISADVAMPAIKKCRECHVGNRPARGKIRSTCDSCHRFHQDTK